MRQSLILQSDRQSGCICSAEGYKHTIFLKQHAKGENGISLLTSHIILFVVEGRARYTIMGVVTEVESNRFVFLPASTNLLWEALEDTTVLMFRLDRLPGRLPECRMFRFQRQPDDMPAKVERGIYPLTINKHIKCFIDDVLISQCDGLTCGNYAEHLAAILLTRIQFYYPPQEYMRFYSTVASPDVVFSDLVYEKWMECRTVGQMAKALNTTMRRFTRHFGRAFGQSPGAWLKGRRREHIYQDICSSSMPLGEIAIKYGMSLTNLVRYSRTNFGDTPSRIRTELAKGCGRERKETTQHN